MIRRLLFMITPGLLSLAAVILGAIVSNWKIHLFGILLAAGLIAKHWLGADDSRVMCIGAVLTLLVVVILFFRRSHVFNSEIEQTS